MSGPRSLRGAIDAMCKRCIYDPGARGNWREQVSSCSSADCPLHPSRPISRPKTRAKAAEAIAIGDALVLRFHGPKNGLPGPPSDILEGGAA
jgi:hypothetical protein